VTGTPWQLLPDLTADEFVVLKSDVALRGVTVPVVVDAETGTVIDGHHRVRAWTELRAEGVKVPDYPRDVRRFVDDEDRTAVVLALNLARRHLTRTQRRDLEATLRSQGWSVRRIADAIGVPRSTVGDDLSIVRNRTIGEPEHIQRTTGGTYPARRATPSLFVRGKRDEGRARAALAVLPADASSPSNLLRAEERARIASLARRRATALPDQSSGTGWEVRAGDFREAFADLPDRSVDAIVTDPPYDAGGVALFDDLGALAARLLKPGRLLVAYVGKVALDEEIAALGRHLEWVWAGATFLPGRHVQIRRRMIRSRWRPVLLFSAGPYTPRTWMLDAFVSEGRGDKTVDDHHWQQSLGPFVRWVEQVSTQDELVVDPFVGGGTTGLACLATKRRFLGCDLDVGAVSLSIERLQAAEAGGPVGLPNDRDEDEPA
jgi:ParB-like chromosome segregation protein Spo0J